MQTEAQLQRDLVRIFRQYRERAHADISQPHNPDVDHLHLTLLSGIRGSSWRGHIVRGLETHIEALEVRLKKQPQASRRVKPGQIPCPSGETLSFRFRCLALCNSVKSTQCKLSHYI